MCRQDLRKRACEIADEAQDLHSALRMDIDSSISDPAASHALWQLVTARRLSTTKRINITS